MTVQPLDLIRRALRPLATAALVAAPGLAAAADTISDAIDSWQAGVICPASFPSGQVEGNLPFVARTQVVPAMLGMGFGIKAQAANPGGIPGVTVVVIHPPFPDGSTRQSYNMAISGQGLSAFYYQFEEPGEVVTGTWRVQAQAGGQVIYDIDFRMIPPSPGDGLLRACGLG